MYFTLIIRTLCEYYEVSFGYICLCYWLRVTPTHTTKKSEVILPERSKPVRTPIQKNSSHTK